MGRVLGGVTGEGDWAQVVWGVLGHGKEFGF